MEELDFSVIIISVRYFNSLWKGRLMKEILYHCVGIVAKFHDKIMQLNNAFETNFSDKDLHFLVIGILGMCMVFVIYPLFKYLAKRNHEMVISWIYVFTVIVVITFAIEIGQKITKTGNMEFADIMYGLVGFMVMFGAFIVVRMIYHGIIKLIKHNRERLEEEHAPQAQPQEEIPQPEQEN